MFALDLHVVVGDLHVQIIGSKMLDVQVDCELFPVRPHLRKHQKQTSWQIHDPVSKLASKKTKNKKLIINRKKLSSEIYLRDARVGKIQKAAKQRLSVIGADGRRRVGEQVVVEHALPEKLVKEPGGVCRAQGASEPGVLDGDIHTDNRQVGSYLLRRRCPVCSEVLQGWRKRKWCQQREGTWGMERLRRAFLLPSPTNSFYTREPKKRGFSSNPSGMALSHGGLEPVSRIGGGVLRMEVLMDGPGGSADVRHWRPHIRRMSRGAKTNSARGKTNRRRVHQRHKRWRHARGK